MRKNKNNINIYSQYDIVSISQGWPLISTWNIWTYISK